MTTNRPTRAPLVACAGCAACNEVTDRYVAARRSRSVGQHDVADRLERHADRLAEAHGLWRQLDAELARETPR